MTPSRSDLTPRAFALALLGLGPAPIGGAVTRPELGLPRVPGGLGCPTAFADDRFGAIALPWPVLHPLLVDVQARREGLDPLHAARVYAERGAGALTPPFALVTIPVLAPRWREAAFPASTELYRRVVMRVQRTLRAAEMPAAFLAMERWELNRAVTELFTGLPPDEDGEPRPGLLASALAWLEREGAPMSGEELLETALA